MANRTRILLSYGGNILFGGRAYATLNGLVQTQKLQVPPELKGAKRLYWIWNNNRNKLTRDWLKVFYEPKGCHRKNSLYFKEMQKFVGGYYRKPVAATLVAAPAFTGQQQPRTTLRRVEGLADLAEEAEIW